jgi:NhaA family Na+:H+ antiporter
MSFNVRNRAAAIQSSWTKVISVPYTHWNWPVMTLKLPSLHPWIAFGLLPAFAFANAGLSLEGVNLASIFAHPLTIGIALGLLLGKPVGIALFSFLAVKTNIAVLPAGVRWSHIIGAGMLGGIGFTMSLFVSKLSFVSAELLNYSKLGILLGSILSAVAGLLFLTYDCSLQSRRDAASST